MVFSGFSVEGTGHRDANLRFYLSAGTIAFIFFVSAIKFGSVVDVTGIGFYPLTVFEWLFFPWPPFLVPAFTGLSLLLTIVAAPRYVYGVVRTHSAILLPAGLLLLATLAGLIKTSEIDHALLFVWHILSVFSFLLSVYIHTTIFPECKQFFLACIVFGAMLSMISGLFQVSSGFDETKEFAIQLARAEGRQLSPSMQDRLSQTRAFATFTYPNSYAAHLILAIPIVLACIWHWSCRVDPPLVSQIIFTGLAAIVSTCTLYFTGSRGAILALALAIGLFALLNRHQIGQWAKRRNRTAMTLILGISLLALFLLLSAFRERTLASASARFDYYTSAIKMFLYHPFAGVGLGEFFTHHLRLKPLNAEETRLAHSLFLHFLSQCGILGGIGAVYFLVQPFLIRHAVKRRHLKAESPTLLNAVLVGCLAWNFHALTDFNVHIPGTMLIVSTCPLLVVAPIKSKELDTHSSTSTWCFTLLVLIAGLGLGSLWRVPGEKSYQVLYNRAISNVDAHALIGRAKSTAKLLPFSPYPWAILGRSALMQNNYELSEFAFRQASKRAPHRASYYKLIAQSLAAQGKIKDAEEYIDKALLWYPLKDEYIEFQEYIQASEIRN